MSDVLTQPRGRNGEYPPVLDLIDASGDCWEWLGTMSRQGYGRVGLDGRRIAAHRLIWTELVGPVPEGMELDHLCRNRGCVNPDHLEPVTSSVNSQRGVRHYSLRDACKNGHPFTSENTVKRSGSGRGCRICMRAQGRADMQRYLQRKRLDALNSKDDE